MKCPYVEYMLGQTTQQTILQGYIYSEIYISLPYCIVYMPKFQRSTNMPKVMRGYEAGYPAVREPRITLVRVAFRNISVLKMWKFVILRKQNTMCSKSLVHFFNAYFSIH